MYQPTLVLFGAGKSASAFIDFFCSENVKNSFHFIVADNFYNASVDKKLTIAGQQYVIMDIANAHTERLELVKKASVVVSLLPPDLHIIIARDCISASTHFLTASYVDDAVRTLSKEIEQRQLFFLYEMGLDPGIDHMSCMAIFDRIYSEGGQITRLFSHCGGLVAPESDDNPWRYKISWNPKNVVNAGKSGASYLLNGNVKEIGYSDVFRDAPTIAVNGLNEPLSYYPNRNSVAYKELYALHNISTLIRTTLRYEAFMNGWQKVIASGLTNDTVFFDATTLTTHQFFSDNLPLEAIRQNDPEFYEQLVFLGLNDTEPFQLPSATNADILQFLLERKLRLASNDLDMIVMQHEIFYENRVGVRQKITSSLIVKGEDSIHTAMAKTVGLPLAIGAKLILENAIQLTGLHIPVHKAIYTPVMQLLPQYGIEFTEVVTNIP